MPVSNSWRRLGRAEKSVVFTVSRSGTRENYGAKACGVVAQGTRPRQRNSRPANRCLPGRMGQVQKPAMVFSAKTEYGLVALIDLAAVYATGERQQTGEISRRHGMPERYLEQMLTSLRKGGFLISVRGPKGGHQLTRSPELITVSEVEDCLEGDARAEAEATASTWSRAQPSRTGFAFSLPWMSRK